MSDNPQYDMMAIIDETEKFAARSKVCLPPRPIKMKGGESYFVQWPMVNLRAKEAEKAAQMFTRQKQMSAMATQGEDMFKDNFSSSVHNLCRYLTIILKMSYLPSMDFEDYEEEDT